MGFDNYSETVSVQLDVVASQQGDLMCMTILVAGASLLTS